MELYTLWRWTTHLSSAETVVHRKHVHSSKDFERSGPIREQRSGVGMAGGNAPDVPEQEWRENWSDQRDRGLKSHTSEQLHCGLVFDSRKKHVTGTGALKCWDVIIFAQVSASRYELA